MRLNFQLSMKSFLHSHKLLVLNFCLLACGLIAGACLYYGKLAGRGDDLGCFNPATWSSGWDDIRWCYMNWDPFISTVLRFPWRTAIWLFRFGPDTFPWWFPASLSLFFFMAAPFNLVMASRKLLNDASKRFSVFMALFLTGLWIINGTVYATTIGMPFSFLAGYNLHIYNVSLALFLVAQTTFGKRWWHWPFVGLLFFLASAGPATMTFSLPVLFAAWATTKMLSQRQTIKVWLRQIGLYALFSVLAVIAVQTAPGHAKRLAAIGIENPTLTFLSNRLPMWYDQSIRLG